MSTENFLSFMQQILTMVDPENPASIELGSLALRTMCSLAETSGKTSGYTSDMMIMAKRRFDSLVRHRDSFIGVPGEYAENMMKRNRLLNVLHPGC